MHLKVHLARLARLCQHHCAGQQGSRGLSLQCADGRRRRLTLPHREWRLV